MFWHMFKGEGSGFWGFGSQVTRVGVPASDIVPFLIWGFGVKGLGVRYEVGHLH